MAEAASALTVSVGTAVSAWKSGVVGSIRRGLRGGAGRESGACRVCSGSRARGVRSSAWGAGLGRDIVGERSGSGRRPTRPVASGISSGFSWAAASDSLRDTSRGKSRAGLGLKIVWASAGASGVGSERIPSPVLVRPAARQRWRTMLRTVAVRRPNHSRWEALAGSWTSASCGMIDGAFEWKNYSSRADCTW